MVAESSMISLLCPENEYWNACHYLTLKHFVANPPSAVLVITGNQQFNIIDAIPQCLWSSFYTFNYY